MKNFNITLIVVLALGLIASTFSIPVFASEPGSEERPNIIYKKHLIAPPLPVKPTPVEYPSAPSLRLNPPVESYQPTPNSFIDRRPFAVAEAPVPKPPIPMANSNPFPEDEIGVSQAPAFRPMVGPQGDVRQFDNAPLHSDPCCYHAVCPDPCAVIRGLGGLVTGPSNIVNCAASQTGCVAKGAVDIVTAAPLFITATLSGGVNCLVGCFCPGSCN